MATVIRDALADKVSSTATSVSSALLSAAEKVGDAAQFLSDSNAPVNKDGGSSVPTFLKQSIIDIEQQVVRGAPFSPRDLPAYIDAARNLNNGVGINDRLFLLEKLIVLMSRLPDDSQFSARLQQTLIQVLYKDLPHPPEAFLAYASPNAPAPRTSSSNGHPSSDIPSGADGYSSYVARSPDGSGYNPFMPTLGKAGTPYARTVPGLDLSSKQSLPCAALVFDSLMKRANVSPSQNYSIKDTKGFEPHPGGLSGFFFAFANLIIHSCFETDHKDPNINSVSSYLDLSPLYGSNAEQNDSVREKDENGLKLGYGRLFEDVFADRRVLFMPPNVSALLIMFCRNHNYIADQLYAINEFGNYAPPSGLSEEQLLKQDDEIFNRARLVNCGFFMQVILRDYVGAILGLIRDGSYWRLDPLSTNRQTNHDLLPRAEGNDVSIEFNLLYRWHAALSVPDTTWTENLFTQAFNLTEDKGFDDITPMEFIKTYGKFYGELGSDPLEWPVTDYWGNELNRTRSGKFEDKDIAKILQDSTEASASAFKARGIPEVLRVVEIMGIESSRRWGVCTINEFRAFFGLRKYSTFKEWNPSPAIYLAAEALYGHIDNLELYPGLMAEASKSPGPGAGLCPGYTISRAILSDAVALTRGDRFLTTEFTTNNLTSWGYKYCFVDQKNDGSFGGTLSKMLMTLLPDYYPVGSVYSHFPFMCASRMKGFLKEHNNPQLAWYTDTKPPVPQNTVIVTSAEGIKTVIENDAFTKDGKIQMLLGESVHINPTTVDLVLLSPHNLMHYTEAIYDISKQLIREWSYPLANSPHCTTDVVRNVANLVPIRFVANYVIGLLIKTSETERGAFNEKEFYTKFAEVAEFLFVNQNPAHTWALRQKSKATAEQIVGIIQDQWARYENNLFSMRGLIDAVAHFITSPNMDYSQAFYEDLKNFGKNASGATLADSMFATLIPSMPLYSAAIAQLVDHYLDHPNDCRRMLTLIQQQSCSPGAQAEIQLQLQQILSASPPVTGILREAHSSVVLADGEPVNKNQKVYCNLLQANAQQEATQGVWNIFPHGLMHPRFFATTAPQVLRAIFSLKEVHRTRNSTGRLYRINQEVRGHPEHAYVDFDGQITPWPVSLFVRYSQ